jgi:hypothetical protein
VLHLWTVVPDTVLPDPVIADTVATDIFIVRKLSGTATMPATLRHSPRARREPVPLPP